MYVQISMTICTECVSAQGGQEGVDLLELELWELGTQRRASGKTASARNCWVTSPAADVNVKDG